MINFNKIIRLLCGIDSNQFGCVDGLRPLYNAIIQNTVTVEAYVKDRCGFWSTNHFGKGAGGNHAADHGPHVTAPGLHLED
jgi:hypothetical protein